MLGGTPPLQQTGGVAGNTRLPALPDSVHGVAEKKTPAWPGWQEPLPDSLPCLLASDSFGCQNLNPGTRIRTLGDRQNLLLLFFSPPSILCANTSRFLPRDGQAGKSLGEEGLDFLFLFGEVAKKIHPTTGAGMWEGLIS